MVAATSGDRAGTGPSQLTRRGPDALVHRARLQGRHDLRYFRHHGSSLINPVLRIFLAEVEAAFRSSPNAEVWRNRAHVTEGDKREPVKTGRGIVPYYGRPRTPTTGQGVAAGGSVPGQSSTRNGPSVAFSSRARITSAVSSGSESPRHRNTNPLHRRLVPWRHSHSDVFP